MISSDHILNILSRIRYEKLQFALEIEPKPNLEAIEIDTSSKIRNFPSSDVKTYTTEYHNSRYLLYLRAKVLINM